MAALSVTAARMNHLADLHAIESTVTPEFEEWSKTRLDRMLADYLLRRGYSDAASALARSRGITVSIAATTLQRLNACALSTPLTSFRSWSISSCSRRLLASRGLWRHLCQGLRPNAPAQQR